MVVNYDNRFSCTGEKEKKGEMGGERKRSWGGERKRGESEVRQSSPDRIFIFDRLSGAVLWETPSSFLFLSSSLHVRAHATVVNQDTSPTRTPSQLSASACIRSQIPMCCFHFVGR